MKYYYDLHIHSCLSPCADDDMTPANIVGMAKLAGLDIIAITDHNSAKNARVAMEVSKKIDGPLVLAGMELETSESIHALVLFEDIEGAEEFEKEVWKDCFTIKNRQDIYGNQYIVDENDEVVGEIENLLLVSTSIGIYELADRAERFGGVVAYAHVDRPAHGVLNILGDIDELAKINCAEISKSGGEAVLKHLTGIVGCVIYNSDAHSLGDIFDNEGVNYLELDELSPKRVLEALK